jgi:hypothetical protein
MAHSKSKKDKTSSAAPPPDSLELDEDEIELIVRVLERHLRTLPSYLLSMQEEICLIQSILRKLS